MEQPIVVGINGLDCSGKTNYAKALYENLNSRNIQCSLLHIDDYNNLEAQKLIYDAYVKGRFTEDLLNLFYDKSIHYDNVADAITMSCAQVDVTIIEGVFLFKDYLAPLLDLKIFLPIDIDVARSRYEKRKPLVGDDRPLLVFDDIWLPTFERYVRAVQPEEICDFTA